MAVIGSTGEESGTRTVVVSLAQVARSTSELSKVCLVLRGTTVSGQVDVAAGDCNPKGRQLSFSPKSVS